jgi:hypothetical protein
MVARFGTAFALHGFGALARRPGRNMLRASLLQRLAFLFPSKSCHRVSSLRYLWRRL